MFHKNAFRIIGCLSIIFVVSMFLSIGVAQEQENVDVYGRPLPENAAPYEMQVWTALCNSGRTELSLASAVTVYSRVCDQSSFDKFGDSLVVLDENLNTIPAAAESWEVSEDGLIWTFRLRPDQVWSDGTPLTAQDWVATWQFMADPATAYDFVWLWLGIIEGWDEAVAGEIPVEEIGMTAVDDLTLQIRTQEPFPPLPSTMLFWPPLQAKSLERYGAAYLIDPEKSVSSGPFVLKEFTPGSRVVLEANPTYNGYRKPRLKEIRGIYGDQLNGSFLAFQDYQIERVNYQFITPADFEIIDSDPILRENYRPSGGDFRTDYLLFDTFNPPFNDRNVRLAFAKAVDRESIVNNVIGERVAIPAHSFLAPGFPASDVDGDLRDIQAFDCEAARDLLAEAGFPDGEGFPAQEFLLRGEPEFIASWYIAAAASISQCLNVEISVNNLEFQDYMNRLLERPTRLQFGGVSYGMDYLDPANMLGVWVSTGRHSWRNAEFDELVRQANSFLGDPEERLNMYRQAERILVEDVGGIFLAHRIQGDLWQPYVSGGECFRPDNQGVSTWHWGNDWCWGEFYITNEVFDYPTYRTE